MKISILAKIQLSRTEKVDMHFPCTSPMIGQQLSLFDDMDEPVKVVHGYVMDISEVPMKNWRGFRMQILTPS